MKIRILDFYILVLIPGSIYSQNLGIGTLTPAFKLDVKYGSINTDSMYRINRNIVLAARGSGTYVGVTNAATITTGSYNTAIGFWALNQNTTGEMNTANGVFALTANTSGSRNTANGVSTLHANTSGVNNTAVGYNAMYTNTVGSGNAAFGYGAMYLNTSGSNNTAIGTNAFYFNAGSHYSTAIGGLSLQNTTNSQFNTAVGYGAGRVYNAGWNNTIIGASAEISFNGQYNAIAIGNGAISTDNSRVRIGNSSNWSYEAFANWTNISDGNFKKNIKENVSGLSFIMKLRPVTYNMDMVALASKFKEWEGDEADEYRQKAIAEKEAMVWTGFVAQEVESAAKEVNYNFSGVDKPRNQYGVYGLRYAEFVVPLVKAVQEQQAQIESLKQVNNEQRQLIDALVNRMNMMQNQAAGKLNSN